MSLGRMLIVLGLLVAALGVVVSLAERLPIRLGRTLGRLPRRHRDPGQALRILFPASDLPADQRGSIAGFMADKPPLES
jgi:hypothetical protein